MSIECDIEWLWAHIYPEEIAGKDVLEVGARNWQNFSGGYEPVITRYVQAMGPASYTGIDKMEGRGVTEVLDVCCLAATKGLWRYDAVFSVAMLEHVENWQLAVENMLAVLKPGGTIWISSNTPGFQRHAYPEDYWRFTPDIWGRALSGLDALLIEENVKEHVLNARGTKPVLEAVAVP